jgi:hypothetical protein
MSEINVVSTTQRIVVDPFSSAVAVINAGPMGPAGPPGQVGPPGPGTPNEYVKADGSVAMSGMLSTPGFFSAAFTLADDQACYIPFPAASIQSCLWIVGNTAVAGAALVAFRCGDTSGYASGLAIAGTLTTGTGPLATGTTGGTDGSLNVFAELAPAPRLYVKNRTAATRSYRYTILGSVAATAPILL